MGFEQLASLKEQLARQAEVDRLAKPVKTGRPVAPKKSNPVVGSKKANPDVASRKSNPVDPVVLSIAKLQRRFPKTFPKGPAPKVPLKVGIYKDLLEQAGALDLSETALRDAIKTWCQGSRYWACMVEDAMRVDLEGRDAGRVLPAEAARARWLAAKRHKMKGAAPVKTRQANTRQANTGQVDTSQVDTNQVDTSQVDTSQVDTSQASTSQVDTGQS
jgi:ProP effector